MESRSALRPLLGTVKALVAAWVLSAFRMRPRPPATPRVLSSKSVTSSKMADQLRARGVVWARENEELRGVETRGPDGNSQVTPSVRPLGWQLAQAHQPLSAMTPWLGRSVPPAASGPALAGPMPVLNSSLPRWTVAAALPAAG